MVGKSANSGFIRPDLEAVLDDIGATTLVICGVLTSNSVEATARHAGGLGYQTFVVGDASWAVDKVDLGAGAGRRTTCMRFPSPIFTASMRPSSTRRRRCRLLRPRRRGNDGAVGVRDDLSNRAR